MHLIRSMGGRQATAMGSMRRHGASPRARRARGSLFFPLRGSELTVSVHG